MYNSGMAREDAYDKARKEFYQLRLREDIERRVAKEEALYVGAQFGYSALEKGMRMEDRRFEAWKRYAIKEAEMAQKIQDAAALTAQQNNETGGFANELPHHEEDAPDDLG